MEEKKKGVNVEVDELPEHDAQGSNDRRDAPKKDPHENDSEICDCRWCPKHSPRKRKLTVMPCGHMMGGRNLIVCIDGTANQFGEKNTNVIELYNLLLKDMDDNQRTWYNSGIGTYARPHWRSPKYWQQVVVHKIDLTIAWNFDLTVQAAYRWLADNYKEGDCIFLFGFSRGAFQVRALSGMIHKVGLIHKGNEVQIPFAYELYADPKSDNEEAPQVGSTDKKVSMAQRFKEAFSRRNVRVHFVGAWDTVSSIGVARGKRVLPETTEGMTHVCYFRHALALDERRVKFLPEYAWGGTTLPPESEAKHKSGRRSHSDRVHPQVLEVWFPGTHSDIGGGNAKNAGMDRSRPPQRWMASQAAELGLRIGPFKRELLLSEQIEFRESLTGLWHLFELLPFRRLTFARSQPGINTTRMPHLWSHRKIHDGQKIHYSLVLGKTESAYVPKARPPSDNPSFWDTLRNEPFQNSTQLLEIEMFYRGADAVTKILAGSPVDDLLKQIFADETGPQLFYDEVIETIRSWNERKPELALNVKHQLLHRTVDILQGKSGSIKLRKWGYIGTHLVELLKSGSDEDRRVVKGFQQQYTQDINCLFELQGHRGLVWSVAISPDGKRIVSGSRDNTIRIWDMETGAQVGEPLLGHGGHINSVAISPDGKLIVSGSSDMTIRIWDAETGMQVGESLRGHEHSVLSVAFSHDGQRIISGSRDNTIRIWDAAAGTQVGVPLQGHTDWVRSVAISPNGKRIVSSSDDKTIRIWDAEKGTQLGEPLQGHRSPVWSVAISPDGQRIVSGSLDDTIRIWDMETGTQVGESLQEHSGNINSVAISPDGTHIISGSDYKMIQIWDLETGKQVGEPLRGHTSCVMSVAISPDGKRIVSGSLDQTVRIWNAEGILV
ncbi:hypothetical protein EST38_g12835 [Candolleomyces aberdarensis]|uniref:T6SS Phospholipase effector Tle1-like catalytic domain-containing protein n=1 Tax=Candolleomyces aberdarensis TaxID=2316362 RepID=A0A4Q2D268_9AGAR|nr:hypothetical protein EST38_g12835 [Candolleomyces aberdarensis]